MGMRPFSLSVQSIDQVCNLGSAGLTVNLMSQGDYKRHMAAIHSDYINLKSLSN